MELAWELWGAQWNWNFPLLSGRKIKASSRFFDNQQMGNEGQARSYSLIYPLSARVHKRDKDKPSSCAERTAPIQHIKRILYHSSQEILSIRNEPKEPRLERETGEGDVWIDLGHCLLEGRWNGIRIVHMVWFPRNCRRSTSRNRGKSRQQIFSSTLGRSCEAKRFVLRYIIDGLCGQSFESGRIYPSRRQLDWSLFCSFFVFWSRRTQASHVFTDLTDSYSRNNLGGSSYLLRRYGLGMWMEPFRWRTLGFGHLRGGPFLSQTPLGSTASKLWPTPRQTSGMHGSFRCTTAAIGIRSTVFRSAAATTHTPSENAYTCFYQAKGDRVLCPRKPRFVECFVAPFAPCRERVRLAVFGKTLIIDWTKAKPTHFYKSLVGETKPMLQYYINYEGHDDVHNVNEICSHAIRERQHCMYKTGTRLYTIFSPLWQATKLHVTKEPKNYATERQERS